MKVKFVIKKYIDAETKWYYQNKTFNGAFSSVWPNAAILYDSYEEAEKNVPRDKGFYKIDKIFVVF